MRTVRDGSSKGSWVPLVATGLAAGRLVIGTALWLAPDACARALGFGRLDPPALTIARIAATRDIVLGTWQLRSLGEATELRRASAAVAVADAGDAVAFALLLRHSGERRAAVRGLAGALPAALAGAWLTRQGRI